MAEFRKYGEQNINISKNHYTTFARTAKDCFVFGGAV